MTNTTNEEGNNTDEDQPWIDFCETIRETLPDAATAIQLGSFFYWIMALYRHTPNSMHLAMSLALDDYQRSEWSVPDGTTMH